MGIGVRVKAEVVKELEKNKKNIVIPMFVYYVRSGRQKQSANTREGVRLSRRIYVNSP